MATYDYINQSMMATCLIEPKDIDSFYNPITQLHTGFAWDGQLYSAGVVQPGPVYASWYTEGVSAYRGALQTFPQAGLVLLSKASLTILDESTTALTLWMQFLIEDQFALADNWNAALNGWLPASVIYADGVISVGYAPDAGNQGNPNINSNMAIHIDFVQDTVYLDVAVQ